MPEPGNQGHARRNVEELNSRGASAAMSSVTFDVLAAAISKAEMVVRSSESSGKKVRRISALDFTKGALVLVMVLYHWLNYFVGPSGFFYIYLRFLPPSFICITGFLISHVYLAKYQITDARLPKRLAVRGMKLLGIFVLLNLLVGLLTRGPEGFVNAFTPEALESIYVSGNMTAGRLVAFYVLLPISYLLLASGGLLIVCRRFKQMFQVVCVLFFIAVLALDVSGYRSGNLELLAIGMLGISIGYVSIDKINRVIRNRYAVMSVYCAYLAAITVFNVNYPMLIVGVVLTLMLIYLLGDLGGDRGRVQQSIILLGKYSLFGYIAQIAILQVLRRSLQHAELSPWAMLTSFAVAVALTLISVELVDRTRAKAPIVNRVYGAVFS